jgi:hypothetical protein
MPCQRPDGDIQPDVDEEYLLQHGFCGTSTNPRPTDDDGITFSCGGDNTADLARPDPNGGLCEALNETWIYNRFYCNAIKRPGERILLKGNCGENTDGNTADSFFTAQDLNLAEYCLPRTTPKNGIDNGDFFIYDNQYYCCTDEVYGGTDKNCLPCKDDECQTSEENKTTRTTRWLAYESSQQEEDVYYESYFRHYSADALRRKVRAAYTGSDVLSKQEDLHVACYGPLHEFAPHSEVGPDLLQKTIDPTEDEVVNNDHHQCVIGTARDQYATLFNLVQENEQSLEYLQAGKAEYRLDKQLIPDTSDPGRDNYYKRARNEYEQWESCRFTLVACKMFRQHC